MREITKTTKTIILSPEDTEVAINAFLRSLGRIEKVKKDQIIKVIQNDDYFELIVDISEPDELPF